MPKCVCSSKYSADLWGIVGGSEYDLQACQQHHSFFSPTTRPCTCAATSQESPSRKSLGSQSLHSGSPSKDAYAEPVVIKPSASEVSLACKQAVKNSKKSDKKGSGSKVVAVNGQVASGKMSSSGVTMRVRPENSHRSPVRDIFRRFSLRYRKKKNDKDPRKRPRKLVSVV